MQAANSVSYTVKSELLRTGMPSGWPTIAACVMQMVGRQANNHTDIINAGDSVLGYGSPTNAILCITSVMLQLRYDEA